MVVRNGGQVGLSPRKPTVPALLRSHNLSARGFPQGGSSPCRRGRNGKENGRGSRPGLAGWDSTDEEEERQFPSVGTRKLKICCDWATQPPTHHLSSASARHGSHHTTSVC